MDILKTYKNECSKIVLPLGFKSYKNSFYKITNDVKQTFELRRFRSGWQCTVDFGILPLCYKINNKNDGVSYELGLLDGSRQLWEYNPNDEESIKNSINSLVMYMNEWLIPFFENGKTCVEAYEMICNLEKRVFGQVHMNDYVKYCMALKTGMYDIALLHLKAIEKQWGNAYKDRLENGYLTEEYAKKKKTEFEELRKEISCVSKKDINYIANFITKNEEYSFKVLLS